MPSMESVSATGVFLIFMTHLNANGNPAKNSSSIAPDGSRNELMSFSFSPTEIKVRYETIDGEPWFVANDVCEILGIANSRDALSRLDSDEQGVGNTYAYRGQKMNIVNESGLYSLIFQSRKPAARKFRKWVTMEVLPSIRRTGKYTVRKYMQGELPFDQKPSAAHLLSLCRQLEENGVTWYCAADLLMLKGHSRYGSDTRRLHKMREAGTAKKQEDWPYAWYVSDVKKFMGIRKRDVLSAALVNYISQGGAL